MATAGATVGTAAAEEEEAAVSAALARLRPRSAPEVVDASVQLVKQAFWPMLVLGAVNVIPALLLAPVMRRLMPVGGHMPSARQIAGLAGIAVIWLCFYSVGTGAMVRVASDAVLGRSLDAGAALRAALSRVGALVMTHLAAFFRAFLVVMATAFVAALVVGLTMAVFVNVAKTLPIADAVAIVGVVGAFAAGLALLTRYTVMTPAVMVEGLGARAALARSTELTAGNRGRLLVLLAALYATNLGASTATRLMLQSMTRSEILAVAITSVLWIPVGAFVTCIFTLLYYDLRIRREGFDIELLAGRLTTPTPPPA